MATGGREGRSHILNCVDFTSCVIIERLISYTFLPSLV